MHRLFTQSARSLKRSCLSKNWNSVNDFFEYTRGLNVSNEDHELSIRRVKFDMNELARLAADSVGSREYAHIEKFPDGMFNKTLLFTMANGAEVVGKVPNPNAGQPHFTTASEVATMEFVRRP